MKPIFSIILIGLIILVAFQVYALVNPAIDTPEGQLLSNNQKTDDTQTPSKASRFEPAKLNKVIEKVTQRNLFKVRVNGEHKKTPEPVNLNLEKTSLELTLLGTVTGQKKQDDWAVMQDIKTKQQELYQVDDKIQGATIKSILRNKVILTVNGKDQILEVNADPSPSQNRTRGFSGRQPMHPRHDIMDRPNMPDAVSQSNPWFKARPYVRNGEASGVMIYSIKKDSVFQLLGLRNGDIIQAVDDVEIQDIQDLENFDDSISDHSDITISILRRGKSKELVFSGQDNAYTINDVE
ncbi:type II secretory pathway, component PulC [Desulfobacter hydrogenophilus]|uniref:PDZ domain-containing protein n=1 Tax=Desulfobacter hydrogenophilus TaxID=2291 RepID=A0A328FAD1_9BACT|nr:type II secretion system protein N [Desulfobacter hydrogenophilus]NDY72096.1 PDZ domain-containing protein [Desulfobacter hydrogenophilus]QBH14821.1 PDZ domain-containing protein [Desulfobacter hydrogenophilus]RAM01329.1 type II secretory pathway, component PulC [Desulfobacter hydrogenophilus]